MPIKLTIVSPVYNEVEVLPEFLARLDALIPTLTATCTIASDELEILLVNDGATDGSLAVMQAHLKPPYALANLSRNFGHQAAITAGIELARGEAVVVLDADLQDPPELIPELYLTHLKGYDVVYAVREDRQGETWFKRQTASWFYKLIAALSPVPIPQNTGDFRLMSRRVITAFSQMQERHRFIRGMISFVGYPQIGIPYVRQARGAGTTKYPLSKMLTLALDAITSFSALPLRFTFWIGIIVSIIGFIYGIFTLFEKLILHSTIQGWTSLMIVILILGGIQLIFLGLIGEYLGRIHDEIKRRPIYILESLTHGQ